MSVITLAAAVDRETHYDRDAGHDAGRGEGACQLCGGRSRLRHLDHGSSVDLLCLDCHLESVRADAL